MFVRLLYLAEALQNAVHVAAGNTRWWASWEPKHPPRRGLPRPPPCGRGWACRSRWGQLIRPSHRGSIETKRQRKSTACRTAYGCRRKKSSKLQASRLTQAGRLTEAYPELKSLYPSELKEQLD